MRELLFHDFKIADLFTIKSGDYHAMKELDEGSIPLISCGDLENGFIGFFDVPESKRYKNLITVAFNGQPLTAKYHPYEFGAKDDIAVLKPKHAMSESALVFVVSAINRMKWRFSYNRKCFKEKLSNLAVSLPAQFDGDNAIVDIAEMERVVGHASVADLLPEAGPVGNVSTPAMAWHDFNITDLFDLSRGDFHSIADLDSGSYPTVSRTSLNNGIVGNYDRPLGADLYRPGVVTISTVSGDSFLQLAEFLATDNVIICSPKSDFSIETLLFVVFILNRQRWRYSYGRQCYLAKAKQIRVSLPVDGSGGVDQVLIGRYVRATPYWKLTEKQLGDVSTDRTNLK